MTQLTQAIARAVQLTDLRPVPHTNTVLSALVESVVRASDEEARAVAEPIRHKLRYISGMAEGQLEIHWARRILASDNPAQTLMEFPYYENYVQLVRQEVALLEQTGLVLQGVRRCLVIGSGPLPLTAIHLRSHLNKSVAIDHVDQAYDAIQYCTSISTIAGSVEDRHYEATGQDVSLSHRYDLVLIAALAGDTIEDKQAIIDNILPHVSTNGRILVRSAQGARGLLYPVFSSRSLRNVELMAEHHPGDETINSVFIYQKGGRA